MGGGRFSAESEAVTDSLNERAYSFRYRHLDSLEWLAHEALTLATRSGYADGEAEALDNLGFLAIMQMDFDRADSLYHCIHKLTRNELYRLSADVGLMKVCQRTAQNKAFYDYKGCAENHIRRIAEDIDVLDSAAQARFVAVQAEYYIVTSTYYYYLQQEEQSMQAIEAILPEELAQRDKAMWLYYLYMKGSGGLCRGETAEEVAIHEFDYLIRGLQVAAREGYIYFRANCLQGIAALLADPQTGEAVRRNRPVAMKMLLSEAGGVTQRTDSLPEALGFARQALSLFKQYDDIYQIAGAYRTIASCLIGEERYAEAVDTLSRSLDYVNRHHRTYYHCEDTTHQLMTYNADEEFPLELEWTSDERVQTVPEWILGIREQLSLAYSGMNLKEASDYNRNIYLDMLEVVRQDKEWENRYDTLEHEERMLDLLLWGTAVALLAGIVLFVLLDRRWKRRHARQTEWLKTTLELCRRVMQGETVPADGVIAPYLTWAAENARRMEALDEETLRMEEERAMYRRQIAANRRENLVKRACLSIVTGIMPFIDRLKHETGRLVKDTHPDNEARQERFRYMRELIDKINEYNHLLDGWIKMKQGTLKLHIESFAMAELFDILAKSRQGFEKKGLDFNLVQTEAWVKADRALTLFMLNTLLENARKYTQEGGHVTVGTEEHADGVEVIVEDNGPGIPEEDIRCILEEKFYDPSAIGRRSPHFAEINKKKGHGFGLMNCKGIIEKYRKTSDTFKCCQFRIRQSEGGGTRVSFVLPRGVKRAWMVLLVCACSVMQTLASVQDENLWLEEAAYYADQAYYRNVDGVYDSALVYIDSVITCLNRHYLLTATSPDTTCLLTLTGEGKAAETRWLAEGVKTDYHIILDIRNEAAVSFLALRRWAEYRYNNSAYARLYKQVSRDESLEEYCRELTRSASDKTVILLLIILLMLTAGIAYYWLYLRRKLSHRFHLQQIFEVNRMVFAASGERHSSASGEEMLLHILHTAWGGINDIFTLQTLALLVKKEGADEDTFVCLPEADEMHRLHLSTRMAGFMKSIDARMPVPPATESDLMLPLIVGGEESRSCIGVMALCRQSGGWDEDDTLLARLLGGFIAIVIQNRVLRPETRYEQIDTLRDEARRAHHEEMQLHVQNTVLDNCLSTIKHETLYYPGRIAHTLDGLMKGAADESSALHDMDELVSYYKEVFGLLTGHALRQCEEVAFRRSTFPASSLAAHLTHYFTKAVHQRMRKMGEGEEHLPTLTLLPSEEVMLTGDYHALCFLLENLVDEALSHPEGGELQLAVGMAGEFARFDFCDKRRCPTQQELNRLFSPEHLRETGFATVEAHSLKGTEYLVCRQIIREHDEYLGHPGCRINAEADKQGRGFAVWFTVPGRKEEQEFGSSGV